MIENWSFVCFCMSNLDSYVIVVMFVSCNYFAVEFHVRVDILYFLVCTLKPVILLGSVAFLCSLNLCSSGNEIYDFQSFHTHITDTCSTK